MNRSIVSEAVVLSSKPFSEADKLITVFSKNFGKLTLVAKGVRRLKSRKRGSLEPFSVVTFSAFKGKAIPIMTEVEIINNFSDARKDLKKISVAYFFLEVVAKTTRDEEVHAEVYELLVNSLKRLEEETHLRKLRKEFSITLSEILGFIPRGEFVPNADELIESIIERKLGSVRVGKKLQV